jgi:hypothetical protein
LLCLVYVRFLPGGSLGMDEFFSRINARWSCSNGVGGGTELSDIKRIERTNSPTDGVCIADYDSIEQFAFDISVMPGAGIGSIEVVPVEEAVQMPHLAGVGHAGMAGTISVGVRHPGSQSAEMTPSVFLTDRETEEAI